MNLFMSIAIFMMTIPYVLPLFTQMVFKLLVWPWDFRYFKGSCTLRKAFPSYQKSELGQLIQKLQGENENHQEIDRLKSLYGLNASKTVHEDIGLDGALFVSERNDFLTNEIIRMN